VEFSRVGAPPPLFGRPSSWHPHHQQSVFQSAPVAHIKYLKTGLQVRRLPGKLIQSVARFQLSRHKLRIETGRHERPREEKEDRLCPRCRVLSEKRAPIGDEHELMFDCQASADTRPRDVRLQAAQERDWMKHPDIELVGE
jgi:hypothetical protein